MDNPKIDSLRRLRGSILYPSTPGRPAPLPAETPQERAADRAAVWLASCIICLSLLAFGLASVYAALPMPVVP